MEVKFRWHGDMLEPLPEHQSWCDEHMVIGMIYRFEPIMPRSMNVHRHQFAFIREGFKQLPERIAKHFKNEEHLRKWLLMKEGYADQKDFIFDSERDMNATLHMARRLADVEKSYSIFKVDYDNLRFTQFTAKSQSQKDMSPAEFRESKQKILDRLASMIGVTPGELKGNADKAA